MASQRRPYRKRADRPVVAVRLTLDTDGLVYRKWGGEQRAKPGDWVVDNGGDVYTVDAEVFARTYRQTGPGTYVKTAIVWAERAASPGRVRTREGFTAFAAGDYLVSNRPEGGSGAPDDYAVAAATFDALYEPVEFPPGPSGGRT